MSAGLKIETAASVLARDMVKKHLQTFSHVIAHDRAAGQSVVAEYINGLAGVMALIISGGHASQGECVQYVEKKLAEYLQRDLQHLRRD